MAPVAVGEEDNNSLLWSNKKEPIRISYGGNDDCVQRNRQIVMDALGNGTLQWSRESKSSSFPLKLHFSLSLVPFDTENSIIKANAKGMEEILNTEFAFVHLYFISVANFEEYRVSVRSDVSEWFSTLNDANCQHWLIIFDSSRTKDKKSRVQVMDKLKSDFARFNNRLYESSDLSAEKTTSTDPFGSLLQITFFASLDNYTNLLTANLLRLKGFINENSFSPTSLINEQFRLAHFYRDLGLFEMALNELNSLASFLTDSIRALAQKNDSALNSLNWLQQLRLLPLDKCCTLLSLQMFSKWAPEEWPLVKIQAHLLAHQILLNGQLLSHKLSIANAPAVQTTVQKPSEKPEKSKSAGKATEDPVPEPQLNTLQLRHNSVTAVLGHTQEAFRRLEEDLLILKANYNPVLLHCLFVVWQTEVFELGRHLLAQQHEGVHDLLEVGSASTHINFLLSKKCQAIMHLHTVVEAKQSQEFTIARRWLEQTPVSVPASSPVDNISLELLDHFGKFSQVFCSADAAKFAEFAKSQLQEALLAFKHFGWAGHVRWVEQSLAELPKSKVSAESEFKFAMAKLLKLITGQSSRFACDVASELRTTLEKYGSQMEQHGGHRELLFDCCLVMLQLEKAEPEEITKLNSRLQELATRIGTEQITRINSRWLPPKPVVPFPVRISRICSPALLHCVLNRPVMFELDLANQLPVSLAECLLTAKFQRISAQNSKSDIPVAENISFRQASISATGTGGGGGGPDSKSNNNGNSSANANATNVVYSLECLLPQKSAIAGDKEPRTEDASKENARNVEEEPESASFDVHSTDPISLLPGKNRCTFPIVQLNQEVGCFRLHSLLVQCPALHCSFTLDYLHEINRNRLLEHVFCFVDIVKPRVSLVGHESRREESGADATDSEKKNSDGAVELAAGMEQHFWLDLSSGTIAFPAPTNLHISAVNLENMNLKFKDSTGKWTSEAAVDFKVPALSVGECHRICVPLCLSLDRICSANEEEEMGEIIEHELSVQWSQANEPIFRQFLRLRFRPIMRLRSSTSFLANSAIFILDVCREHQQGTAADVAHFDVIPRLCSLHQEHNIALEPVEARLLNPKPFGPIVANSTFRFVWQLPDSPIGKAVPIPHFLKFAYSIRARKDDRNGKMAEEEGIEEQAGEEEKRKIDEQQQQFLVDRRLDFPVQKVDFEICARFYSEQSQSVLCRIEQPCDLVVSIRSLPKLNEAETVIVSVEPAAAAKGNGEQQLWQCGERLKLTKVKESGIGQAIFTVVPKMLGYLPFPEISIFKYNIADHSPSSNKHHHSSLNEKHLGRPLVAFYRNRASQIHILAPLHHSEDSASMGSSTNTAESSEHKKKSLKSQAKDRLQKLFE